MKTCKYCHKELEEVECPKDTSKDNLVSSLPLPDIILIPIEILSYFFSKKDKKRKKIVTCNNKDCIDYLNGCFKRKKFISN